MWAGRGQKFTDTTRPLSLFEVETDKAVFEVEADLFGLNAAHEPDAEAHVDLMLGEYRKLDPSPLEEALLYDHPSGRSRILMAMRWKAEHLNDYDIMAGPISPQ